MPILITWLILIVYWILAVFSVSTYESFHLTLTLWDPSNYFYFFRHIRNSLAHGNYTITYEDLNNLSTIKYVFNDEDERTGGTYSVELTAKQLENILAAIQLKINKCDKGYLDGKKVERELIEYALKGMKVGQTDVNQVDIIDEIDKGEEKEGDEGIGKQDS